MEVINFLCLLLAFVSVNSSKKMKQSWWKYTEIYEIFVWSFKDSDGDGIGDIKGIISKLDNFVELNIETLWISPFCKSPMNDMGYDVSDFMDVDPKFGTLADFEELVSEMKKRGLKLIMDFVINHSSDQHIWFNQSTHKIEPYTDYYIWKDAKGYDRNGTPIAPNNWLSVFKGSAWEWNGKRRQFYLHQFSKSQPDLNLRNVLVNEEVKKIVKFWLDKGVSGFRMDATKHYMEDIHFRDEPLIDPSVRYELAKYNDYDHKYTTDHPEIYDFLHELRAYIDDKYNRGHDFEKILFVESYSDVSELMKYYGNESYPVVHFPFNFAFTRLNTFLNASELDSLINVWLRNMPPWGTANWVSENHDNLRIGSRFNEQLMDIMVTLIMLLPGVACFYYGQEIGMVDNKVRPDQRQDLFVNRDSHRLPMQWDDSMNGGFTTKRNPWLPIHPNYWRVNVESEKKQKISRYQMFKTLSWLRKSETSKYGAFKSYILSPWIYAFTRTLEDHPTYIAVFNLGTEIEIIDLHTNIPNLPRFLTVISSSLNSGFIKGSNIPTKPKVPEGLVLRPISCIVFSTVKLKSSI